MWKLREIDNFIVSGDSNGNIIIWDKKSGNSLKVFSELQGDVLAMDINHDQKTIYASGVDTKIVCIRQVQLATKQKHHVIGAKSSVDVEKDWVYSGNTRGQSHDIKSLIYLPENQCLISGGVATDLCVYALEKHGKLQDSFKLKRSNKKPLHIAPFELNNQVSICTQLSSKESWKTEGIMILVLRKTFSIELWMYEQRKQPVFLLEYEKSQFGITSVSVNKSATFICISDIEGTQFYKINIGEDEVNLKRIKQGNAVGMRGVIYTRFMDGKFDILNEINR